MAEGAAGAVVSSVKLPVAAGPVLPAASVRLLRVLQLPSALRSTLAMSWLMRPAAMSAAVSVVLRVSVLPSGRVTTVVSTSPACASAGRPICRGVPPRLAASAALTSGPSGAVTVTAPGAVVSTCRPWLAVLLRP